eukprot:m.124997 g.124997  ORF g.124997 m.124997 type:complete len:337 (+) comp15606_c0_seq1:80-1090(+)
MKSDRFQREALAFIVFLAVSAAVSIRGQGVSGADLHFRSDGTFKIVQFTDQHFGEGEDAAWGREQDVNSTRVMREVLAAEQPDLVVYTGDQLTGNNIDANATDYWLEVITPTLQANRSWAFVFGNHDDLPLQEGTVGLTSITSRTQLLAFDNQHNGSLTRNENPSLTGVSNYHLTVGHSQDNRSTPLFFFDSGGGTLPEYVHADQVNWYRNLTASTTGIAFMHIPLPQYATAQQTGSGCFGMAQDDIAIQEQDTGLFDAFIAQQNVKAVFVGHNHGNDWCCNVQGVWLCYGRHSGYGGYGTWKRGARVLVLRENTTEVETYIRMEDGSIEHEGTLN